MKQIWKRNLVVCLGLVACWLAFVVTHSVVHIGKTIWNDRDELAPPPEGMADDASRLNQTNIAGLWEAPSNEKSAAEELSAMLQKARDNHLKVSIAGSRHSMGGQTIYPGGIVLDMLPFSGMELDESNAILHVQAGARWSYIIPFLNKRGFSVEVMQSNDGFSVGGSISANCHGWQFNRPPIASTVKSFRLMLADGRILKCSRSENADLFSLTLGGYGLFGIILDVELHVMPNQRYRIERITVPTAEYAKVFRQKTATATNIEMFYGRLNVSCDKFLQEGIINLFRRVPGSDRVVTDLSGVKHVMLKRAIFRGGVGSPYGKELRWNTEKYFDAAVEGNTFDRNSILYEPSAWFEDHSKATTDILVECFIPPKQFASFVAELRTIIPRHRGDLLNITVRYLQADKDSFLRYADKNLLSLVMLFNQSRSAKGEEQYAAMTREIIGAALQQGGRYYLPYRLHATPDQFAQAYPQAREFFAAKRKYDPDELFQNEFYLKYGKIASADTRTNN